MQNQMHVHLSRKGCPASPHNRPLKSLSNLFGQFALDPQQMFCDSQLGTLLLQFKYFCPLLHRHLNRSFLFSPSHTTFCRPDRGFHRSRYWCNSGWTQLSVFLPPWLRTVHHVLRPAGLHHLTPLAFHTPTRQLASPIRTSLPAERLPATCLPCIWQPISLDKDLYWPFDNFQLHHLYLRLFCQCVRIILTTHSAV